jgi:hypothetical protein
VDVDEEQQQRRHHGGLADRRDRVVSAFGGPLEQLSRECRVTAGEVEGGDRADGVRMVVESLQQLGGLVQAALSDT